jgi:GDP-L-fucose synthase
MKSKYINQYSKIYVAGHNGMVGSALVRLLKKKGYTNIIVRSRADLDLRDTQPVRDFLAEEKLDFIFIAAARVGGILANNNFRAEFLHDNLMIESNLINGAHLSNVQRLMFLGSSCIYPRECPQPIKEEYLLTGSLEYTNEPYAIAKIAGLKLCESYNAQYARQYFSGMPTNTYGPHDNYHPENSHVLPALILKAHNSKINNEPTMTVWGTGTPKREFIFVDDLADACVHLMEMGYDGPIVNIGSGLDVTIRTLAETVASVVGYKGDLIYDSSKPDGTPRKLMDVSRLTSLGWTAKTELREGIKLAYESSPFFNNNKIET